MSESNQGTILVERFKALIEKRENNGLCYEGQPAKVVKYNYKTRTVNVMPLVKIKDNIGDDIENCELQNIPVVFPSSQEITVSFPLKNTTGWLIFTKIGIENWQLAGNEQSENITTRGSRRNCVFLPSIFDLSAKNNTIDNGDDFIMNFYKKSEFRVKKTGKTKLVFNQIDLLQRVIDLTAKVEELSTHFSTTLATLAGAQYGSIPGPTTCAGDLQQFKSAVDAIKNEIIQIKSDFTTAKV